MNGLTILFPIYNHAEALAAHLAEWADYPVGVQALVVDDGSRTCPLEELRRSPIPTRLYRVLEDIPWNQPGARNLGMLVASTRWVLSTDADHLVPAETVRRLLALEPHGRSVHTFAREGAPTPHCNTLLLTRKTYWEAGGFDEDFSGYYGHDDADFMRRLRRVAHVQHFAHLTVRVIAAARSAVRDPERNAALLRMKHDAMPRDYIRFRWQRML